MTVQIVTRVARKGPQEIVDVILIAIVAEELGKDEPGLQAFERLLDVTARVQLLETHSTLTASW